MSLSISSTFGDEAKSPAQVSRPCFEALEDRRLLSFSPAVNYATIGTPSADRDGRLQQRREARPRHLRQRRHGQLQRAPGQRRGRLRRGAADRHRDRTSPRWRSPTSTTTASPTSWCPTATTALHVLMGNGDGTFQPAVLPRPSGEVAAVGDFNSDSNTDVLVTWLDADWADPSPGVLRRRPGRFRAAGQDALLLGRRVDGRPSISITTASSTWSPADGVVFLGNGDGSFQFDWEQPAPLNGGAIATGDFTGDGNADAIVAGDNDVAVLRGRGDGTFDAPITHAADGTAHTGVATADFNGDGKLDAVVSNGDTGTVSLMLGNGDGTLRYAGAFATGTSPSGVVVGDFNRDGRPDVAVSNAASTNRLGPAQRRRLGRASRRRPSADQRRDRHRRQHRHGQRHLHGEPLARRRRRRDGPVQHRRTSPPPPAATTRPRPAR